VVRQLDGHQYSTHVLGLPRGGFVLGMHVAWCGLFVCLFWFVDIFCFQAKVFDTYDYHDT
jgi:hypothetical protein